jgi:hypothetical protein
MSPDAAYRLEEILALLSEHDLNKLAEAWETRDSIPAVRDAMLGPDGHILERIEALSDDDRIALRQLVSVLPPVAPSEEEPDEAVERLRAAGLVFVLTIQHQARLYVPLEVQIEVARDHVLADPDLRLLLMHLGEEELARLESFYCVGNDDDDDDDEEDDEEEAQAREAARAKAARAKSVRGAADDEEEDDDGVADLQRICRLADAMERPSTLRAVYKTLPAAATEILGWTCEHSGPLGADEVHDLVDDATAFHSERVGAALGQLQRFGLLMSVTLDEAGDVYLVPRSLRPAVLDIIENNLTHRARSLFEDLVRSGHLGFPDEGPHGWGGDALRALRLLTVNWVSGVLDELPTAYGVAVGMQLLNPEDREPATFASLLLDLSGETALARQAMRLWLALADDPWTLDLVNATGGDSAAIVEYFATQDAEDAAEDAEIWFGHLFLMRAQLLFVLSLLAPGKWFTVEALANLFHTLVARSTLSNLTHEVLSDDFPFAALPDYGIVLAREERRAQIRTWLEAWLTEFASVIGAAQVDPSGTLVRVHPDAFCVFRDSDVWFRAVWEDLARVVGEDLDIWMPIPNDPGPRVSGVSEIRAVGVTKVALDPSPHLHDLVRLAQWGVPIPDPGGFGFELSEATVSAALEAGRDGEELLQWLAVRMHGDLPTGLRALFPHSSSAVDGGVEQWQAAARSRIGDLLGSLESWGNSPPGQLLESIRGWGPAAKAPLQAFLGSLVEAGALDDPRVQHACVLIGELGAVEALDLLLAVLLDAQTELFTHAAAAACMRLGAPCLPSLVRIVSSESVAKERRLLAAMALTGLATLHPSCYRQVGDAIMGVIEKTAFDTDLQTRFTLELCRMGHPAAESVIEELRANDAWLSADWRPEDALWLARISPCVWGSLLFSTPMAMLYLVSEEAEELARESGVRDLLRNAGLSSEAVLYGRPRPPTDE